MMAMMAESAAATEADGPSAEPLTHVLMVEDDEGIAVDHPSLARDLLWLSWV